MGMDVSQTHFERCRGPSEIGHGIIGHDAQLIPSEMTIFVGETTLVCLKKQAFLLV